MSEYHVKRTAIYSMTSIADAWSLKAGAVVLHDVSVVRDLLEDINLLAEELKPHVLGCVAGELFDSNLLHASPEALIHLYTETGNRSDTRVAHSYTEQAQSSHIDVTLS